MDRFLETEKKIETEEQTIKSTEKPFLPERKVQKTSEVDMNIDSEVFAIDNTAEKEETPVVNSYINSFENKTIADIKNEEFIKQESEIQKRKAELIDEIYKPSMTVGELRKTQTIQQETVKAKKEENREIETKSTKIIEKPNYDLIQENKKIVKLTKKTKEKKKLTRKTAGLILACALGASGIACVANVAIIENMYSSYTQIDKTYNFNLQKYLRSINNLDATKKSMEFLETYPDEVLDAGDLGQHSNWFDRLCNFIGGLFGG